MKGACAMVQRNTEGYKTPEITKTAGYYMVKWDGLDELKRKLDRPWLSPSGTAEGNFRVH